MKRLILLCTTLLTLSIALPGCGQKELLTPEDPVVLSMWHVYGEQADSPMNRLVDEFNETVGREKGVILNVTLMTNSSAVGEQLLAAQAGAAGSPDFPDLFFCHTNNASALGADRLLDWHDCFTEEECSRFVDSFLEEGMIGDRLSVLPVSKSTHLLFLNGSLFDRFAADTGASRADLATWDGFFRTAGLYCEWSGGQPFCALDFLLRAVELDAAGQGRSIALTEGWYDPADAALQECWADFADALVRGHIVVSDLYSNTQVMTGEVAAGLGSSASVLYYNDTVTYADNTSEPMALDILPMPQAADDLPVATQAGVGLCSSAATPEKKAAASLFAHWLTEEQRNLDFVTRTGYMPVTDGAYSLISDYDFPDVVYERLYYTLDAVRQNCTSLREPDAAGYYAHVNALYEALRTNQALWSRRYADGADPQLLIQESWDLFSSIR